MRLALENELFTIRQLLLLFFFMAYDVSINVRLDEATRSRLDRLADGFGVKSAVLIRQAIEDYLTKLEHDGKIIISLRRDPPPETSRVSLNEKPTPPYGKKKKSIG